MPITTIAPTILSKDSAEYKAVIKKYYGFAKRVHIDVSDGSLTSATTVPLSAVWWPKGWTTDIHLMSAEPSKHVDTILKLRPNLVIFHAEAKEDLKPIFKTLQDNGIKAGVAIVKGIYPGNIRGILEAADHALIFSGNLGQYGGTADLLLLEKVALIQNIKRSIEIGWDGGANKDNIHILAHGGVNVINCGSAISKADDPAKAYNDLDALTESERIF